MEGIYNNVVQIARDVCQIAGFSVEAQVHVFVCKLSGVELFVFVEFR